MVAGAPGSNHKQVAERRAWIKTLSKPAFNAIIPPTRNCPQTVPSSEDHLFKCLEIQWLFPIQAIPVIAGNDDGLAFLAKRWWQGPAIRTQRKQCFLCRCRKKETCCYQAPPNRLETASFSQCQQPQALLPAFIDISNCIHSAYYGWRYFQWLYGLREGGRTEPLASSYRIGTFCHWATFRALETRERIVPSHSEQAN